MTENYIELVTNQNEDHLYVEPIAHDSAMNASSQNAIEIREMLSEAIKSNIPWKKFILVVVASNAVCVFATAVLFVLKQEYVQLNNNNEVQIAALQLTTKGAATYVSWGRTICPGNGSDLMYSGYAAGDWWEPGKGSAANFLCLPKNPDWYQNSNASKSNRGAKVYGMEYGRIYGEAIQKKHGDYEVPCALCQSTTRISVLMIPGKTQCFPGWHLEYRGYLMCGLQTHSPSEYVCVDAHLETIGSSKDENGQILHAVEAGCGSLKCPPYVRNRELTCVVCTR